jgi:hypothetical protein
MVAKKKATTAKVQAKKLKLKRETLRDLEVKKAQGLIKGGGIKSRAFAC